MSPPVSLLSDIYQNSFAAQNNKPLDSEGIGFSEKYQDPPSPLPDVVLVDFDTEGKAIRQEKSQQLLGHKTTIAGDNSDLLVHALSQKTTPVVVRLGRYDGERTDSKIRDFQSRGVVGFLLSMVEHESEIEQSRKVLSPGVVLGAMIETSRAVGRIDQLKDQGLDFAFVGLVDLAIQRRSRSIFCPLIDGTIEEISQKLDGVPYGFGAATVVGSGSPVPNRFLLAEMLGNDASFTFLRSAFFKDIQGLNVAEEVARLRGSIFELQERSVLDIQNDHAELRVRLTELLKG